MAVPVRPLLAIGLASAGIGVTLAVAAAPQAAAAPTTSGTSSTTSTNHRSHSDREPALGQEIGHRYTLWRLYRWLRVLHGDHIPIAFVDESRPPSPRQPLVSPPARLRGPHPRHAHRHQARRERPLHRRPRKARRRRRTHSCLPPTKRRRPSSTTGAHTTATTGSCSKTGIAVVRGWPRSCRRPVWWTASRHRV